MKLDLIIGNHLSMFGMTWSCEFVFAIVNFIESNTDQEFPIKMKCLDLNTF